MVKRRQLFSLASAALVGSMLLAGCLGSPPDRGGADSTTPTAIADKGLETNSISLGFIPILEAAPLVVAFEKGYFAKHGLDVTLIKQPSWPAARDNVVLGSEAGGIDGGQWQMPMPQMIGEGAITDGQKVPMYILAMLMSQGNGIAASNNIKLANLSVDLKGSASFFSDFSKREGRKFRASYTFPKSNQDIWIRYWLAAGGIHPDKEVELLTVPSTETLQGLRNGTMEAFSTGDPWPSRIARDDSGYLPAITAQLWKVHPEEYLAVRADWVDRHPKATIALIKAVIEAQRWMDKAENRSEVAKMLSSRQWFNTPVGVLEESIKGQYLLGAERKPETDPALGPLYWDSDRGVISYPYKSMTLWFLLESMRWKFYPGIMDTVAQAKAINNKVTREDLWIQAARELGLPAAQIPTSSSRGKETFFNGIVYDPEDPQAYLDSQKIKN